MLAAGAEAAGAAGAADASSSSTNVSSISVLDSVLVGDLAGDDCIDELALESKPEYLSNPPYVSVCFGEAIVARARVVVSVV